MASWREIEADAPAFARHVRERFEVGRHKTLATLRRDGSPRISGIEADFVDGELRLGMMAGSRKLADVRRDPRIALHSPTFDPPADATQWRGDAKLAGRLVEVQRPAGDPHAGSGSFTVDIEEVALTYVGDPTDHLVIETWHAGRGHTRHKRYDPTE